MRPTGVRAAEVEETSEHPLLGGRVERLHERIGETFDADESTFRISRNTSEPLSPATSNTLQACSLSMECTEAQPRVDLFDRGGLTEARYVVPR